MNYFYKIVALALAFAIYFGVKAEHRKTRHAVFVASLYSAPERQVRRVMLDRDYTVTNIVWRDVE